MHEPLVPMLFPVLGTQISGSEFQYPDLTWKEMCGQMAHLVAESGGNKGQLSLLVEAICRDFRQHDEGNASERSKDESLRPLRGSPLPLRGGDGVSIFFTDRIIQTPPLTPPLLASLR
jgi:hypothetical protein